jgi:L-serine kinase (ADP)
LVEPTLARVDPAKLKQHEEVEPPRLRRVVHAMRKAGMLRKALAADEKTLVLLDGTHRLEALRKLGCTSVPVALFDYMSDEIVVKPGARKVAYSKDAVLEAGISGKVLPPKSTRHMIRRKDGSLMHISKVEPIVDMSLEEMGAPPPGRRPSRR